MTGTLDFAVHRRPSGADTRTTSGGALVTSVLYAPAVPTSHVSAGRLLIPGNRHLPVHRDPAAETALVLLSGYAAVLSGRSLRPMLPAPGDLVYVRRNLPYAVINLSRNAAVLMLAVTTDPRFWSALEAVPDLEPTLLARAEQLRTDHFERITHRRVGATRRPR
ncbi:hypothetical protein [Amycolatopsis sp. DSM 110486]|uniref:hypothetical protein n=1 Tax=Amycolatopsis sp. DSM 110486 TaxID=2865832 RepID=UPI001C6A212B|nr:hypothetical protein [Amycolatopsis sp. DSM 110486]QYN18915.1 hypothetical protein K1T34_40490 [Amycolatopsis sp. DSM 110486]